MAPDLRLHAVAAAMHPVVFEGCFGWLHAAAPTGSAGRAPVGVVICSPLGRDARCVHLPMRLFAERLARSGVPTLRYDHADTGDSLDLAPDADALPVWLDGVARAVETLRAQTGVERVVLCGARIGATLAAAVGGPDGLILFSPVVSGRAWTSKAAFAAQAASGGARPSDGSLDTDGMRLSAATLRSVAGLDMLRTASTPPRALIFTHGRSADAYVRHLQGAGVEVAEVPFEGHADLFAESHSNAPPLPVFDRAATWLAESFPCDGHRMASSSAMLAASRSEDRVFEAAALRGGDVSEAPVRFGGGLNGVFAAPAGRTPADRAVLFCNTGGDPRAGIGRLAVQGARELARHGVASLRFDFAGLGDSPMPLGEPRSHVYRQDRRGDMDAALSFLQARGFAQVHVFGVCSGAYHALHGALHDERIAGVFAVNPLRLVWTGEEIVFGERAVAYAGKLRDISNWRRLVTGEVRIGAISRVLRAKLHAQLAARARSGPAAELRRGLAKLSTRGGRIHLLVGAEDAAIDEVQAYLGRGGRKLRRLPGMSVQIEPGLDHGLSRSASRETALEALWTWLGLERERKPDAAEATAERPGGLASAA